MAAQGPTTVVAMMTTAAEAADPLDLVAARPGGVAVVAAAAVVADAAHPLSICTGGGRGYPSKGA